MGLVKGRAAATKGGKETETERALLRNGRGERGNSREDGSFPVTVHPTLHSDLRSTGPSGLQSLPALSPIPAGRPELLTSQAAPWLPSRLEICSYQVLTSCRGDFNSRPNPDPSSPPPATSPPMSHGHPCAGAHVRGGVLTPSSSRGPSASGPEPSLCFPATLSPRRWLLRGL